MGLPARRASAAAKPVRNEARGKPQDRTNTLTTSLIKFSARVDGSGARRASGPFSQRVLTTLGNTVSGGSFFLLIPKESVSILEGLRGRRIAFGKRHLDLKQPVKESRSGSSARV